MRAPDKQPIQALFARVRPHEKPIKAWHGILVFIEHPLFLCVLGIIGGIVGVLLVIPVLIICDLCLLLALHRSQAVAAQSRKRQLATYLTLFVVSGVILIGVGILVKTNAHAFALEVANAVVSVIRPSVPAVAVARQNPA